MRRHQLITAAAAGLIAAVIAGALAYATIPDDGNVYTACMLKNVGTVRLIDPSLPSSNLMSHCTSLETKVSWNQKGLPGVAGAAGAAGKDGIDGIDGKAGVDGKTGIDGKPGEDGKDGESGIAGPKGDKGDPGLRFRGTWNQFVDYLSGDVVQHGGSSWVATEFACCGAEPGVSDKWSVLAAAGASGWEIRKSEVVQVPGANAAVDASVACPAGKRAVGGGFSANSFHVTVTNSRPTESGDAWYGAARGEPSTSGGFFVLYVICENVTV